MKEYGCQKWQNVSHSGYETGRQFSNENEFAGGSAMNFNEAALKLHEEHHGKIEVVSKVPVKTRDDLSTAYTPGVAEPCRKIHDNKKDVYKYTAKGNLVGCLRRNRSFRPRKHRTGSRYAGYGRKGSPL